MTKLLLNQWEIWVWETADSITAKIPNWKLPESQWIMITTKTRESLEEELRSITLNLNIIKLAEEIQLEDSLESH
jgi:hypothetical protein